MTFLRACLAAIRLNLASLYAYRISLNPLYFIGIGVVALLFAWATIFVHAQRVARANPIHALRYE